MKDSKHLLKVLIVDDSPEDCMLLSTVLHRSPNLKVVATLRDGQEALDFLYGPKPHRRSVPDLVFLDLDMPHVDGLEVLSRVKEHRDRPGIIAVLTGCSDADKHLRALALGADFVESKPHDMAGLSRVVTTIVRLVRAGHARAAAGALPNMRVRAGRQAPRISHPIGAH